MSESPATKLIRLLSGVLLTQGRLGHQVLGQLLLLDSTEVELAAASAAVAATQNQHGAFGQIVVRTLAPALAVQALARKQEQRLARLAKRLAEDEAQLERELRAVREREQALGLPVRPLRRPARRLRSRAAVQLQAAKESISELEDAYRAVQDELAKRPT